MASLFPLISAPADETAQAQSPTAAMYREVAWDHANNRPLWRGGSPVWVTGAEAVASWVASTLHTERRGRELVGADYGLELRELAGRGYTEAVKQSEAIRYVRECLEINPYITAVRQISVDFSGTLLTVQCIVDTIYGEVSVDVAGL